MGLLAIALGGALGAVARYGVTGWVQSIAGASFPLGTMTVNVAGSLALGFLFHYAEAAVVSPGLRQFLAIGLLGSFTTFSTFTYETVALVRSGDALRALAYAGGSVLLGLAGLLLGVYAASLALHGRP